MRKKLDPVLLLGRLQLRGFEKGDDHNGAFRVTCPLTGRRLNVIVSNGDSWEHVSVSLAGKNTLTTTPLWEEMAWVRGLVWRDSETVMQLHVPAADHISFHDGCLHLWRPQHGEIPRPPAYMVYASPEEIENMAKERGEAAVYVKEQTGD